MVRAIAIALAGAAFVLPGSASACGADRCDKQASVATDPSPSKAAKKPARKSDAPKLRIDPAAEATQSDGGADQSDSPLRNFLDLFRVVSI